MRYKATATDPKNKKGKLWNLVREYILKRDDYRCVTCDRSRDQGNIMQGGHFQPVGLVGSNNTLSWDERNIYAQCAYCNGIGQGQQVLMAEHIARVHGKKVLEELKARRFKIDPVKDWDKLTKEYEKKMQAL